MRTKILLFFFFLSSFSLHAQDCAETEVQVIFDFLTDNYAYESTWTIIGVDGITYSIQPEGMENATTYSDTICAPAGMCLTLTIGDTAKDGICCGFG